MRYREIIPSPLRWRHAASWWRPPSEGISPGSEASPVRILPEGSAPRRTFDVRGFAGLSRSLFEETRP